MKCGFLVLLTLLAMPGWAQEPPVSVQLEHTKATLVAEHDALTPGRPLQAAVLLEMRPGWHSYWENPGDAGIPTSLDWTLPEGFSASGIDWPPPEAIAEGPLLVYGYHDRVLLPVTITPPAALDSAPAYPITVKAEWLVCKEVCIPESAELRLALPVAEAAAPSPHAPLFAAHRADRPAALSAPGAFAATEGVLTLSLPLAALKNPEIQAAGFFIREPNIIRYAAAQKLSVGKDALRLDIERAGDAPGASVSGILAVTHSDGAVARYQLRFAAAASAGNAVETPGIPGILLLAFLGGMILNLMPCVLPILSLKALAVAKKSGRSQAHVAAQGVGYTLGVLAAFGAIAGVLIALRQAGEAVGWGYQMQSPAFVGFLIYLLFLVGLSLSGLFHLPALLGSAGGRIADESSMRGSFLTGMLATAVATPCTAPFMATAVGAALTLPAALSLLVFAALGLGLAFPFLMISLSPALRAFLPKPGAWMEIFKQLTAFPMYASVIWLLWVLALQTGADGMAIALGGLLLIVMGIWMQPLLARAGHRRALLLVCAGLLALSLASLERRLAAPTLHAETGIQTVAYSPETLDALRQAGTPVFVDATAAWCITCQVNARLALRRERVIGAFKEKNAVLMVADWTRRDDAITAFLSGFGYKGVPLYVYYGKDAEPVVLPQLLTEDIVIRTLDGEASR